MISGRRRWSDVFYLYFICHECNLVPSYVRKRKNLYREKGKLHIKTIQINKKHSKPEDTYDFQFEMNVP